MHGFPADIGIATKADQESGTLQSQAKVGNTPSG